MEQELIKKIIESYSGDNLIEDLKFAVAQEVVNQAKDSAEALKILGTSRNGLNLWFRSGMLERPSWHLSPPRGFKPGHSISPAVEKKRRKGFDSYIKKQRRLKRKEND